MAYPISLNGIAAVIPAGASLSSPTPLGAGALAGLVMPAVWTPANLSLQASADGGLTWQELQDGLGNAVIFTVSAGIAFNINPSLWCGFNFFVVRSGILGAPVAQAVAATITLQTIPQFG